MDACRVCSRLAALSGSGAHVGTVHTVFDHAINAVFPERLVAVTMAPRTLGPYGCSVAAGKPLSQLGVRQGEAVCLDESGLTFASGLTVSFSKAEAVALSTETIALDSDQIHLQPRLQPVLAALRAGEEPLGLSPLVTGGTGNVYTAFLSPRLAELFKAVGANSGQAVEHMARVAGCGVGLTPSSDDLLTGYFLAIRLLSRFGRMRDVRALIPRMAAAAAQKTNRISGAFLLSSGEGLASEDVLTLLAAIFSDASDAAVQQAAERVASFGSTSGRDMLTGLVLAIQHHDGGKNSGQTGNQKERVL